MPLIVIGAIEAVGLVVSAYGQHKAGQAAKAAGTDNQGVYNLQAGQSDYNATVADAQAADATAIGAQDEAKFRAGVKGLIGSQRAGYGGGGVDVGSGSAVDVQADTAYRGELDALTIRSNAARTAWGYQVQAQDFRTTAATQRAEGVIAAKTGANAATAANWGAAGTIIGGGANIAAQQYQWSKAA